MVELDTEWKHVECDRKMRRKKKSIFITLVVSSIIISSTSSPVCQYIRHGPKYSHIITTADRQVCFVSVLVILYQDCGYITNPKIHTLYQGEEGGGAGTITQACQIIMSKALKEEGRKKRLEIIIL